MQIQFLLANPTRDFEDATNLRPALAATSQCGFTHTVKMFGMKHVAFDHPCEYQIGSSQSAVASTVLRRS